jgi:urea carboxylase
MEGPGGYQFVGRTVQMWNTYRQTTDFEAGKPWLLRFFDQIRFYPVSAAELLQHRNDFLQGKFKLQIEEEVFSLKKYNQFLQSISESAISFKNKQQAAFEAERDRWAANNLLVEELDVLPAIDDSEFELPPNSQVVPSPIPASVWQILVEKGDEVREGDRLVILESMKMEMTINTPISGKVIEVFCNLGQMVSSGQTLFAIQSLAADS